MYNLHQKPKAIFKDSGFKLAVINQLMFKENLLKPHFMGRSVPSLRPICYLE
ncbi:DUF6892 domain-containing protein [Bisgaard Taxon 46]